MSEKNTLNKWRANKAWNALPLLPPSIELETKVVLIQVPASNLTTVIPA